MKDGHRAQLIAIVGGSGAGKGWLASRLCRVLGPRAAHLQLDDFYRDRSHLPLSRRARLNFDVPHAVDWEWAGRVLQGCRTGERVLVPRYDFATHSRLSFGHPLEPPPLVFVDGLWLLRPPAIRQLFGLKLFLDTPEELRHSRRLLRDVAERGYNAESVEYRFRTAVAPMHQRYVEPQKRWADLVLQQPFTEAQVSQLATAVLRLLGPDTAQAALHQKLEAELLDSLLTHEYCH
jgi:uridine kinase